jgi:hypothetical protein
MDRRNKKHRGSPQPGAVLKIWGECPNGIGEKKVHKPITSFLSQGCELSYLVALTRNGFEGRRPYGGTRLVLLATLGQTVDGTFSQLPA